MAGSSESDGVAVLTALAVALSVEGSTSSASAPTSMTACIRPTRRWIRAIRLPPVHHRNRRTSTVRPGLQGVNRIFAAPPVRGRDGYGMTCPAFGGVHLTDRSPGVSSTPARCRSRPGRAVDVVCRGPLGRGPSRRGDRERGGASAAADQANGGAGGDARLHALISEHLAEVWANLAEGASVDSLFMWGIRCHS